MMNMNRPIQQASWRTHRQRVGTILLGIVGSIMVLALYLSLASHSTLIGREVQTLEREIRLSKQENANLKTELARLLSYRAIEARGSELGFYPAAATETHYILVPGYSGREPTILMHDSNSNNEIVLPTTEYSQSLFDWLNLSTR